MALIDDDEIKEMRRQVLRLIPNDIEHGGIGRDIDAAVFGDEFFADIGPAWFVGQMLFEGAKRLFAQGDAVDQKKHLLGMAGPHQGIDQGNAGARLAGTGGHHQQEVALLLLDAFQHRANGADLIITACNRRIDQLLREWFAIAAYVLKALQIVACRKTHHFARRIVFQIPEVSFEAVGIKAKWQLAAQLFLNVVAVLFGLFAAHERHPCWFSLLRPRPAVCRLCPAERNR